MLEGAITYANLLALLSFGLTITYITTSVPNFAQGSFAVFGSYMAYILFYIFKFHPYSSLPIVFVFGGMMGILCYLLVLRPLIKRGASIVSLMIATLALDLILLGIIGAISDSVEKILGKSAKKFIFTPYDFDLFAISGILIVSTFVLALVMLSLYFLLYKTSFGIAMRAAMENPNLAEVMGVNVEKVRLFSWSLSAALAAVAGALLPFRQEIVPGTGGIIIVSIFSASIVGGLSSIAGAILGGYLIGLSESLLTFALTPFIGVEVLLYSRVVSLLILILTLLFFPPGLSEVLKKWSRSS